MQQVVDEIHRPARKNFLRRKTIILHRDDLWQGDLADFQKYSKLNKGFKYLLFIIDAYSKFLWIQPLKDKTGKNVSAAFQVILKNSNRKPNNFQSDEGKEFFNQTFSELVKKQGINHYSTYSVKKAAIVERCIRTIKSKLYKKFSLRGKYKWFDIIDDIVEKYNNTVHSTINVKPNSVSKKTKLNAFNHIKIAHLVNKFKVGQWVRINKYRSVFDKSYNPNWSTEMFKIKKVQLTNPTTYLLEDTNANPILGGFYTEELTSVKYPDIYLVEKVLKRKKDKLYVKWLGLNERSWINKKDVFV